MALQTRTGPSLLVVATLGGLAGPAHADDLDADRVSPPKAFHLTVDDQEQRVLNLYRPDAMFDVFLSDVRVVFRPRVLIRFDERFDLHSSAWTTWTTEDGVDLGEALARVEHDEASLQLGSAVDIEVDVEVQSADDPAIVLERLQISLHADGEGTTTVMLPPVSDEPDAGAGPWARVDHLSPRNSGATEVLVGGDRLLSVGLETAWTVHTAVDLDPPDLIQSHDGRAAETNGRIQVGSDLPEALVTYGGSLRATGEVKASIEISFQALLDFGLPHPFPLDLRVQEADLTAWSGPYFLWGAPVTVAHPLPRLGLDDTEVLLAPGPADAPLTAVVPVWNDGDATLVVDASTAGVDGVSVRPSHLEVPPGEQLDLEIQHPQDASTARRAQLILRTNDPARVRRELPILPPGGGDAPEDGGPQRGTCTCAAASPTGVWPALLPALVVLGRRRRRAP